MAAGLHLLVHDKFILKRSVGYLTQILILRKLNFLKTFFVIKVCLHNDVNVTKQTNKYMTMYSG